MIRKTTTPLPRSAVKATPPAVEDLPALERALEEARRAAERTFAEAEAEAVRARRVSDAAEALASGAARVRGAARQAAERALAAEGAAERAGFEAARFGHRADEARSSAERAAAASRASQARLDRARRELRRREEQRARLREISPQEARRIFAARRSKRSERSESARQSPSRNFPVIEGYRVLERAGQDRVGEFYRARQVQLDRAVILKVLHPDRAREAQLVEAFLAEARRAAQFNHPSLVRVHDLGPCGKRYFYATELVDGPSLDSLLRQVGPLEPGRAHRLIRELAAGLARWQAAGLVHGCVNPECVLLDGGGVAKLTGLGLAEGGNGRPPLDARTVNYVAPELAVGREVDARADEYSLGALFYFLLSGRPPHIGATLEEVVSSARRGPTFLAGCAAELPSPARRLIARAMAADPAVRHGGPAELVTALDVIRPPSGAGIPTPSRVKPAVRAAKIAARRRRRRAGR